MPGLCSCLRILSSRIEFNCDNLSRVAPSILKYIFLLQFLFTQCSEEPSGCTHDDSLCTEYSRVCTTLSLLEIVVGLTGYIEPMFKANNRNVLYDGILFRNRIDAKSLDKSEISAVMGKRIQVKEIEIAIYSEIRKRMYELTSAACGHHAKLNTKCWRSEGFIHQNTTANLCGHLKERAIEPATCVAKGTAQGYSFIRSSLTRLLSNAFERQRVLHWERGLGGKGCCRTTEVRRNHYFGRRLK